MSSDPVGAPIRLGPESQSPLPTRTWLQVRSQKCEGRQTHSLTDGESTSSDEESDRLARNFAFREDQLSPQLVAYLVSLTAEDAEGETIVDTVLALGALNEWTVSTCLTDPTPTITQI